MNETNETNVKDESSEVLRRTIDLFFDVPIYAIRGTEKSMWRYILLRNELHGDEHVSRIESELVKRVQDKGDKVLFGFAASLERKIAWLKKRHCKAKNCPCTYVVAAVLGEPFQARKIARYKQEWLAERSKRNDDATLA